MDVDVPSPETPLDLGIPSRSTPPPGASGSGLVAFLQCPQPPAPATPCRPPLPCCSPDACVTGSDCDSQTQANPNLRTPRPGCSFWARYQPNAALGCQGDTVFFKKTINRPPGAPGRSLSCSVTVTVKVTGALTDEFPSLSCYGDPRSCPHPRPKRALFLGRPHHSPGRSKGCILKHPVCYSQAGRGEKAFLAMWGGTHHRCHLGWSVARAMSSRQIPSTLFHSSWKKVPRRTEPSGKSPGEEESVLKFLQVP